MFESNAKKELKKKENLSSKNRINVREEVDFLKESLEEVMYQNN